MKKNKELLNERILGLAGIVPMTSIGLSTNAPIRENEERTGEALQAYQYGFKDGNSGKEAVNSSDRWGPVSYDYDAGYREGRLESMASKIYDEIDNGIPMGQDNLENMIGQYEDMGGDASEFQGNVGKMNEDKEALVDLVHAAMNGDETAAVQLKKMGYEEDEYSQILAMDQGGMLQEGALSEQTVKETIGMVKHSTKYTPHSKNLINERFMGMVGLKPIGGLIGVPSQHSFKQNIKEVQSDLSIHELYKTLPLLHSDCLMELAEEFITNPAGKSWDVIVETLSEEYISNSSAKSSINKKLKSAGLI